MRIVIIGGIAAGMSAAAKARRINPAAEVIVYEKGQIVSFGACGLPYYIGGFFADAEEMLDRSIEKHRASGIDVRIGQEVMKVDFPSKKLWIRDVSCLDCGEALREETYDKLVIATGANVVRPPIPGLDLPNVHFLTKMADGKALRELSERAPNQNVVVIGGGYIGIEVVEAMVHQGHKVRVIEGGARILSASFDVEMTNILEEHIRDQGVDIHLNEKVLRLEGTDAVEKVVGENGEYPADFVIVATGVRPATEIFKETGLHMLPNGAVVVNERGETNIPDVYSAGDCATVWHRVRKEPMYLPLATGANKLGRIVGENASGGDETYPGTLATAAIRVMELEAGRTGIGEQEAIQLGIPYKALVVKDRNHASYVPGQAPIWIKLIVNKETRVLLGAQTLSQSGAVLRIDALAVAIHQEMRVDELRYMDFAYAPPFARMWEAMNIAASALK